MMFVVFLATPSFASAAKIHCWKNSEGTRECGHQVPAEYSQKRVEVVNQRGMVVEVHPEAKSKEQALKEAERKRLEEAQRDRDNVLLRAYTTERDLLIARDNKLAAIEGIIDVTNTNTDAAIHNFGRLQKRAADYERGGKPVPDALIKDIRSTERKIEQNKKFVENKKSEMEVVRKKYNADLKRFKELKSKPLRERLKEEAEAEKTAHAN